MRFNVLGALSVRSGTEALNLGGSKQRTVLAMLIAHAGRGVSADELIEAVYGEDAAPGARRTVQTYVSNLRSVVGDTIHKTTGGWALDAASADIDTALFRDLYESAQEIDENNPEGRAELLRAALRLWRGHPYGDVEAHGCLDAEISRLVELRNAAIADRIDADLAVGRHAELIGEIDALVCEHPYQERFRGQHMLALYRSGRQKAALRSFAAMRELLIEELGIDPTPELQELERQILDQDTALDLAPPRTIETRAVLAADAGDPIELARLSPNSRDELLQRLADCVEMASEAEGADRVDLAGTAFYALFEVPTQAAAAAEAISAHGCGAGLRMAIDWGDVEVGDNACSGPPIVRAARLVAAAHRGQVLISADAQQAMTGRRGRPGMSFEALGEYDLSGLEGRTFVYQLACGSLPREFAGLATDRAPPPLPGVGHRGVPGYELREKIGTGSVGSVYRGYQPSVGREVAVEVIGRAHSSDAGFIRRFEADLQQLSLLEHPSILPILDYWRGTDGAFIVYPLHRGGRLEGSIREVDAAEVIGGVAAALAYSHSWGLVHGRVAPSRVVLDEGGHPYLYGFPVAGIGVRDPGESAFLAAEVIEEAPSVAGDIYALGILAYTLYAGAEPEPDTGVDLSLLDDHIGRVVAKATAVDPAARHASAEEFLADLFPIGADRPAARFTEARNPYKGLAAFQESDASDFYGRSTVVDDLIDVLSVQRFLAVVGPSGIGKSSVVQAGLIPALRKGAIEGSERWLITDMLPGSHPFRELERALERVAVDLPTGLTERLVDRTPGVFEYLDAALPSDSIVLLVVDQFEELFTMADDTTTAQFLDLLREAVANRRVYVVVTLRADFLARPLRYSAFGELLRAGLVTLRSPKPEELADAIRRPAANVGVVVEPALTERIVAAVHDQPGALPLLQCSLSELFEARTSDVITVEDYDAVGGIRGSLARRAETIYSVLDPADREIARQTFLRLVSLHDDGKPSRLRVRVSNLEYLAAQRVVDAFAQRRLLVYDRDLATRAPTVEVAHEALFTHWPRLADWIADLRDDLVLRRRLAQSVDEWEANDREDAFLLSRAQTAQHEEWTGETELTLSQAETDCLEASKAWNQHQAARRRRLRWATLMGFTATAVIAAGLAVVAVINSTRAEEQAALAHSRELAASAINVLDDDPELSVLLALEAAEGADPTFESVAALHQALQEHRTVRTITWPTEWPMSPGLIGSTSPDGRLLAVTGGRHQLAVWDLESGSEEPAWFFEVDASGYATIVPRFTVDGLRVVAVVSWFDLDQPAGLPPPPPEVGVYVFDARTGDVIHHFRKSGCPVLTMFQSAGPFIDDERTMGIGVPSSDDCSIKGAVDVWLMDLATGEMTLGYDHPVFTYPWGTDAVLSDDGRYLAFGDGKSTSFVVDRETGTTILEVPGGEGSLLSGDGSHLIAVGARTVSLWDIASAERVWMAESPVALNQIYANEDANLVYAGAEDGSNRVWDAGTGRLLRTLKGHTGPTWFQSMTTGGTSLATFSTDRTVRLWDLTARAQGEVAGFELPGWPIRQSGKVVGERGAILLYPTPEPALYEPGVAVVFNASSGKIEHVFPGYGGQGVRLSPDGKWLVGQKFVEPEILGPVHVLDVETGEIVLTLEDLCTFDARTAQGGVDCLRDTSMRADSLYWIDFSPDGAVIAIGGGTTGMAGAWDAESGQRLAWLEAGDLVGNDGVVVAFNPGSDLLLVATSSLIVYTTDGWSQIAALPLGRAWLDVLFTPDGRYVIGADTVDGVVTVDTETWDFVGEPLAGHGNTARDIDLNDDGSLIASGASNEFVRVSDLATGELIQAIPLGDTSITLVEFLDDQHLLVVGKGEPAVVVTIDEGELTEIARSRVTRAFSPEECATYHVDPCPTLAEIRSGA